MRMRGGGLKPTTTYDNLRSHFAKPPYSHAITPTYPTHVQRFVCGHDQLPLSVSASPAVRSMANNKKNKKLEAHIAEPSQGRDSVNHPTPMFADTVRVPVKWTRGTHWVFGAGGGGGGGSGGGGGGGASLKARSTPTTEFSDRAAAKAWANNAGILPCSLGNTGGEYPSPSR